MKNKNQRTNLLVITFSIFLIFVIVVGVLLYGSQLEWEPILVFGVVFLGSMVSFLSFYQRQGLEELRLFRELFTEFNERYSKMNDELKRIVTEKAGNSLSEEEKNILYDYFNLCGEEYF